MDRNNTSTKQQMARLKKLAEASEGKPLVMLNINKYRPEVNFPVGQSYLSYMEAITH